MKYKKHIVTLVVLILMCGIASSKHSQSIQNTSNDLLYTDETFRLPVRWDWWLQRVTVGDLNGDGYIDLYFGNRPPLWRKNKKYQVPNFIFVNNGNGYFADMTDYLLPDIPTLTWALLLGDVDNDGDLDIYDGTFDELVPYMSPLQDRILFNNGHGRFKDRTKKHMPKRETYTECAEFGDVDGDGDLDLFQGYWSPEHNFPNIVINNGRGKFRVKGNRLPMIGEYLAGPEFADFDGDGDLDLFIPDFLPGAPHWYLLNDGNGYFSYAPKRKMPPRIKNSLTLDSKAADFDNDGDIDIFISNMLFNRNPGQKNQLLLNNGRGKFRDATHRIMQSRKNNQTSFMDVGDFDDDGDLDVLLGNYYIKEGAIPRGVQLFENNGNAKFRNVTEKYLPPIEACQEARFVDVDNDGDLDILAMKWLLINNLYSPGVSK